MSNEEATLNGVAQLDALASRVQITELIHRYANHVIAGTSQECRTLFVPDATFETREGKPGDAASVRSLSKSVGIEAILAYVGKSAGGVCPMIHNLVIEITGNEAVGTCIMAATVWGSGQMIVGRYRDTFRRNREWLFTSRTYTMFR